MTRNKRSVCHREWEKNCFENFELKRQLKFLIHYKKVWNSWIKTLIIKMNLIDKYFQ